jgi:AcrR family transcriptional regulator
VAKEANVAATSVYLHFSDLNELVLAVLQELFAEQIALRQADEDEFVRAGGSPWKCILAVARAYVAFGLSRPGHYKVLYEGRAIARLDDPKLAGFGRPLLGQTSRLIQATRKDAKLPNSQERSERLGLLLWAGLHGIVSLQTNKPTLNWPNATELAEQIARAVVYSP